MMGYVYSVFRKMINNLFYENFNTTFYKKWKKKLLNINYFFLIIFF